MPIWTKLNDKADCTMVNGWSITRFMEWGKYEYFATKSGENLRTKSWQKIERITTYTKQLKMF